jgi:CheY-like chemotaxis protein
MDEINLNNNKNNSGNLKDNIQHKEIKSIERYSISTILALLLSVILIMFKHPQWAGVLIIAVVALKIIVLRRTITLNERLEALITLMLISEKKKIKILSEFSRKIRGPLNNLIITEDLLAEADLTAKQKEFIETVKTSARNMANVANELTMAVAENMNLESRKQIQFNIGSTKEHVIELYNTESKKNLDIKFEKAETANIECIGDPIIIKQIFIDIFDRIEKQNKGRRVTIKINLSISEELSSENIIAIKVEADMKTPLVVETDAEVSLSVRLISLLKGKYTQNFDDNSVSLTMSFKIKKAIQQSKEKLSSPKIGELINKEKNDKDLKDLRVLLVEDNIMNSKIILLSLKPLVKSVDLASDGKEALSKFATNSYDLILMDVEMPVMDGLMATEKIRALESTTNTHVPIIAITANAMIDDKEKCLSAGADDYISKPFQPANLTEKIKQLI